MSLPENTNKQTTPSLYEIKEDLVSHKITTQTTKEMSPDLPLIQDKQLTSLHCTEVRHIEGPLNGPKIASKYGMEDRIEDVAKKEERGMEKQASEEKINIMPIVNEPIQS